MPRVSTQMAATMAMALRVYHTTATSRREKMWVSVPTGRDMVR